MYYVVLEFENDLNENENENENVSPEKITTIFSLNENRIGICEVSVLPLNKWWGRVSESSSGRWRKHVQLTWNQIGKERTKALIKNIIWPINLIQLD